MSVRNIALFTLLFALQGCFNTDKKPKIKNVILMIGDGMGPQQISLLYYFAKYSNGKVLGMDDFIFKKIADEGTVGVSATEPHSSIVVDSAASATQLALADTTQSEMIGLDSSGKGEETILHKAKKLGLATGLVTDTRMTHATPSAFAAHVINRWQEVDIAKQLIDVGPDVMLSSGINFFISDIPTGFSKADQMPLKPLRSDGLNLLQMAQDKGHQLVFDLEDLRSNQSTKVLGLFTEKDMPDGIWYTNNENNPNRKIPTLLEMTKAAVNIVSKNEKGFFLMIEGGQIDWAGHRNDTGTMLHQMIHFNNTIKWVYEWMKNRDDSLLIVTADHETGAFGFAYNSHETPDERVSTGKNGEAVTYYPHFNYGLPETMEKIYKQNISLYSLWEQFTQLPEDLQNAQSLSAMVKNATHYEMSEGQAQLVLKDIANPRFREGHLVLGQTQLPEIHGLEDYYYDYKNIKTALIARVLGPQQTVTWGTGGHTATPVLVFAAGPKSVTKKFNGYLSHPKIGEMMQEILEVE